MSSLDNGLQTNQPYYYAIRVISAPTDTSIYFGNIRLSATLIN